jgi:plasmid stabilization system protein ParE
VPIWTRSGTTSLDEAAAKQLQHSFGDSITVLHRWRKARLPVSRCRAWEKGSVRKFPVGNYLIYYRPMRAKVMILRVVHGKRIQLRALQSHPRRPRA